MDEPFILADSVGSLQGDGCAGSAQKQGRARIGEPGLRFKLGVRRYSMLISPTVPSVLEPHGHSQPSVQSAQHSLSHGHLGQSLQQAAFASQVLLLLQHSDMAAAVSTAALSAAPHSQSQPSVQSLQHSLSQAQSGQPSQQAALHVPSLLQQPLFAAVPDEDRPKVPAASAASSTKPNDIFANMENYSCEMNQSNSKNGRTRGCCIK
jgi:hypothetical protein